LEGVLHSWHVGSGDKPEAVVGIGDALDHRRDSQKQPGLKGL
jgi:hypothetical protein